MSRVIVKPWSSGSLDLTSTNQVMSSSVLVHKYKKFINKKGKKDNKEALLIMKLRDNSALAR